MDISQNNSKPTSRLIVKNIPKTLDELSLKKVFDKFGEVTDCQIIFKGEINRQIAFVGFRNSENAADCQKKLNQTFLKTSKIIVDFATEKTNFKKPENGQSKTVSQDVIKPISDEDIDDKRLYITNLPYSVTNEDFAETFSKFGKVEKANIIVKNGQSAGYGFITFEDSNVCIRTLHEFDKKSVFGRVIHVAQCRKSPNSAIKNTFASKIEAEKTTFKKIKKKEMIEKLNDDVNWNSSFLNPNTILERMSEKLGVSRKAILDNEVENPAVIKTICEKEILDEVFDFLSGSNINPDIFKQPKKAIKRSTTIILIKNLPYKTIQQKIEDLFSQYGKLENFLLSPNKAIAIAEYQNSEHAQNAFKILFDYVYKGTPIYLEWAPVNIYVDVKLGKKNAENQIVNEDNDLNINDKIVYVKNLSKDTVESEIEDMLNSAELKDFRYIKIIKKDGISIGYGFVEFEESISAQKMIKKFQGHILKNHALKLSISRQKAVQENSKGQKEDNNNAVPASDKLVIKNLPFQTNKQELTSLIKGIVNAKSIRLPQKTDGSLKGFAFVQFASIDECKTAYEALQNLHFYGRKLVLEFGKE